MLWICAVAQYVNHVLCEVLNIARFFNFFNYFCRLLYKLRLWLVNSVMVHVAHTHRIHHPRLLEVLLNLRLLLLLDNGTVPNRVQILTLVVEELLILHSVDLNAFELFRYVVMMDTYPFDLVETAFSSVDPSLPFVVRFTSIEEF